jgi:hypothetical protein
MAKAVDRLHLVADHEEVVAREGLQQGMLAVVDVLDLVDHEQIEALRPAGANLRMLRKQRQRAQLQVVEVQRRAPDLQRP